MKDAISIYRAGDIVSAIECDYNSAKQLGLICPFCKSAVFLKGEYIRSCRGTLQIIDPSFSHYKTGSFEDMDCENRSKSKQGKEEIERLKIESKGQRLKLYNDHLWSMIRDDRNVSRNKTLLASKLLGQTWIDFMVNCVRKELQSDISSYYTVADAAIQKMAANRLEQEDDPFKINPDLPLSKKDWHEEVKVQFDYFSKQNIRLHGAICMEVLDFLATRSGGYALEKILRAAIFMMGGIVSSRDLKKQHPSTWAIFIAGFIAGTHWATIVEKYSKNIND